MSPKAWKTSFYESHRNYSPRGSQRNSFRSSDKSRYGSLSRESSTLGVSSKPSPLEDPLSESRELDDASSHGEGQDAPAVAGETPGHELKSEEDGSQAEGEKGLKETEEEKKDGGKAPPSESSSELNGSCESVSLELQLSAAHIEEDDSTVTPDPAKPNGLVSGLNSDPQDLSTPHKVCFLISTQLKHDADSRYRAL